MRSAPSRVTIVSPSTGATYAEPFAAQRVEIVGVVRLVELEHHVVADVDDVVDRAHAGRCEALTDPLRRRADVHTADHRAGEPRRSDRRRRSSTVACRVGAPLVGGDRGDTFGEGLRQAVRRPGGRRRDVPSNPAGCGSRRGRRRSPERDRAPRRTACREECRREGSRCRRGRRRAQARAPSTACRRSGCRGSASARSPVRRASPCRVWPAGRRRLPAC